MSSEKTGTQIVSFKAKPHGCAEACDFSIMTCWDDAAKISSYFLVHTDQIKPTNEPHVRRFRFPARHEMLLPEQHGEPSEADTIGKLVATFVATPSDGAEQGFRLLELMDEKGQLTGEFYLARNNELACVNLVNRSEYRFKSKLQIFLPCKVELAA